MALVLANTNSVDSSIVSEELLTAIQNFVEDLSNITTDECFQNYATIVKRIDKTKIKAYSTLVIGIKSFLNANSDMLRSGVFNGLSEPNLGYVAEKGSFSFNFENVYQKAEEDEQEAIHAHLNHIWAILTDDKCIEEKYVDKIFSDLQNQFSEIPAYEMTREQQMEVVKNLFADFQTQNMNIAHIIKSACRKSRQILTSGGADENSHALEVIAFVEQIDINNFDMIQFMALVAKIGPLFTDGQNPFNDLLHTIIK
jgi:hypothetical protein